MLEASHGARGVRAALVATALGCASNEHGSSPQGLSSDASGPPAATSGCVVTIEGELAGTYPCIVQRALAADSHDNKDGFVIRVDARVDAPDDQVSVIIGCLAPAKLSPGRYHLVPKSTQAVRQSCSCCAG